MNPHALFGHQALNLARLPIPPLRRGCFAASRKDPVRRQKDSAPTTNLHPYGVPVLVVEDELEVVTPPTSVVVGTVGVGLIWIPHCAASQVIPAGDAA